jgi:hypothetical protein
MALAASASNSLADARKGHGVEFNSAVAFLLFLDP